MTDSEVTSEDMTVAELFALAGSSNHEANEKTIQDMFDVLSELHPAVAGSLVRHIRTGIDTESKRGTASGSEHPDWHQSLQLVQKQSLEEGYD